MTRFFLIAAFFVLLWGGFHPSSARATISLTKLDDTAFGTVTSLPPKPTSGTNAIELGTNGTISCDADYTCPATGTAGRVRINGTGGWNVSISCDANGVLDNANGAAGDGTLTTSTRLRIVGSGGSGGLSTGAAAPGTGYQCTGLGSSVATFTLSGTSSNNVLMVGPWIDATDVKLKGQYARPTFTIQVQQTSGTSPNTVTIDVPATISFINVLGLINGVTMVIGPIDVTGTVGAGDTATLNPRTGNATYAGDFTGPGTGTRASVDISGVQDGETVEVRCATTATLRQASGSASIQVDSMRASEQGAGSDSACNGTGGAAARTFTYNATTKKTAYFGGRLNGATASSFTNGNYSSGNPSGVALAVAIVIQ